MNRFSTNLNTAWQRSGLKKGELATALNVDPTTVSRWFGGQLPEAATLKRLADLLGTSCGDLLEDEDADPVPAPLAPDLREEVRRLKIEICRQRRHLAEEAYFAALSEIREEEEALGLR